MRDRRRQARLRPGPAPRALAGDRRPRVRRDLRAAPARPRARAGRRPPHRWRSAAPHAPQLQMLLPLLRERVNAALGPGTVGRIQLTQAVPGFAEPPARLPPRGPAVAAGRPRRDRRRRSQALVMATCATPWRHWRGMCYPEPETPQTDRNLKPMPDLTRRQTLACRRSPPGRRRGLPVRALAQPTPAVAGHDAWAIPTRR